MRFLAFAALAAAAFFTGACQQEPATTSDDGFRPDPQPEKGDLVLTVTPAEKTVPLGGEIVLRCKIENKGTVTARVNEPRLSDDSVSFKVRTAAFDTAWIQRRRVRESPQGAMPDMPIAADLAPGKSIEKEIKVVAVLAGKWTLFPVYRCQASPQPIMGDNFTVEVKPDGANDRVGVKIETSEGDIVVALRPDLAFNTCEAFASLAKRGFLDGTPFHRVIQGFVAQGGDPKGLGWGGPGYQLRRELHGKLPHQRGVLAMARSQDPHSAGSQFYICFGPLPDLDQMGYTTFAEMTEGGEAALKRLEAVGAPRDGSRGEAPSKPIVLKRASLVTTTRP